MSELLPLIMYLFILNSHQLLISVLNFSVFELVQILPFELDHIKRCFTELFTKWQIVLKMIRAQLFKASLA